MTAKDVINPLSVSGPLSPINTVNADMPLLEVLPHLLDAPERLLGVTDAGESIGMIDSASLLAGLGRFIAVRDDSSIITVECTPSQYSASALAHAVEDADMHLVDLMSRPADGGKLLVTLRVRSTDPTAAIHSLERYGYRVVTASHGDTAAERLIAERLASLNVLMNV